MAIRTIKRTMPSPRLHPINFFSIGSSGSTSCAEISSLRLGDDMRYPFYQLASGGLKPLKNSQEINKPTQITNPNRLTK